MVSISCSVLILSCEEIRMFRVSCLLSNLLWLLKNFNNLWIIIFKEWYKTEIQLFLLKTVKHKCLNPASIPGAWRRTRVLPLLTQLGSSRDWPETVESYGCWLAAPDCGGGEGGCSDIGRAGCVHTCHVEVLLQRSGRALCGSCVQGVCGWIGKGHKNQTYL